MRASSRIYSSNVGITMTPRSHDKLHTEIYQDVYALLERKDEEALRFAPDGTAEQVLHADKLRRFFRSLLDPDHTTLVQFKATEDELIAKVKERRLQPFLAVLIIAGCSMTTARTVTTKLIANKPPRNRQGTATGSLPIDQEDLRGIFNGNTVDTDKFLGKQAYFCPVVIRNRQETRIEDTNHRRLPYLEEQSLQKGSFGHVFRVKIAKGHFYDPVRKTVNPEPLEVARKDYELSSEFDAAGEREIMEQIFASSASSCPNILNNMGSLAFGPTVYSLFMPLAICDLRQYMMQLHQARLNSTEERMEILRCAIGLAGGLHFLHREMRTRDMAHLACYHMDLKPSNILIFRETGGNGEICNIWKISDFGMSRMKIRRSQERVEREKDVNSWFIRRSAPEDPSTAPTKNRRAEGTYLAPESVSPEPTMNTRSDVWSLGCVLSVVFSHMEDGSEGARKYAAQRLRQDDAVGYDRFFVLTRGFKAAKLNPAVRKTHAYLVQRASSRSLEEGHLMKAALEFLENHVLQIDQRRREDAKKLESMLEGTFKDYMKLLAGPSVAKPPPKPRGERIRQKVLASISPKPKEPAHGTAETWCLSEVEPFKGCQISPDCSFVAYWTDRKILLYSKHSLNSANAHDITSAAQYTIDREACFWNTIRLTDKYLAASTTSATFQCYIFDLGDSDLNILRIVDLPQPAISKLAISPKSNTVACVVRSSDDDRKPGSLLIFRLCEFFPRVLRLARRAIGEVPGRGGAPDESTDIYGDTWWKCPLEWPARNIARMLFSTEEDVYFVVRPELTVRNSRKRVYVVHVNISTKDLHFLPIEPLGLDSSTTARLFTTFSPFVAEAATCAVVTREKQLHIHNLMADDSATPIGKDIKNYRIVKLLKGSEDHRLYAVARQLGNYKMMLVEMTVPRSNDDEVQTRELANLPDLADDDQFIARLLNETNGKSVLIASVVGSGQRAIHRVGFDGHQ